MRNLTFLFIYFFWFLQLISGQSLPNISAEVQRIIDRWGGWARSGAPHVIAQMSEEERRVLRDYYRTSLKEVDTPEATLWVQQARVTPYRKQLLYLGDQKIVADAVATSLQSEPGSFDQSFQDLYSASLPEVIPLAAPRIFVDEPYIFTSFGDAGGVVPKSYSYTELIRSTLQKSPAFNDEVRDWAKAHFGVTSQQLLPVIRQWWKENEPLFQVKNYGAVKPGTDIYTAERAKRDAFAARRQAFSDGLRAQGKNPGNRLHWDGWEGTKIDPSEMKPKYPEQWTPAPKPTLPIGQGPIRAWEVPAWGWTAGIAILAGLGALAWRLRK